MAKVDLLLAVAPEYTAWVSGSGIPGMIRTPLYEQTLRSYPQLVESFVAMEPVGRMGKPEEIA